MSDQHAVEWVAVQEVLDAGRSLGTAAVHFHSVVADLQGIGTTEEKAIDILQRFGPMTAGELAERTCLAPPSVTGLLGRLQTKGFIERLSDPGDGRRVLVRLVESRLREFYPLFADLVQGMQQATSGHQSHLPLHQQLPK